MGARDIKAQSTPIPAFPRTRGKEKTAACDGQFALTDWHYARGEACVCCIVREADPCLDRAHVRYERSVGRVGKDRHGQGRSPAAAVDRGQQLEGCRCRSDARAATDAGAKPVKNRVSGKSNDTWAFDGLSGRQASSIHACIALTAQEEIWPGTEGTSVRGRRANPPADRFAINGPLFQRGRFGIGREASGGRARA